MLTSKSCPLFKATLPVYFVGILSTLVDIELLKWPSLYRTQTINSEEPEKKTMSKSVESSNSIASKSKIEKQIDHMNNYLKNVFFTLSLSQANLDGLIVIYEQMK